MSSREISRFIDNLQVIPTTTIEHTAEVKGISQVFNYFRQRTQNFTNVTPESLVDLLRTQDYGLHILRLTFDKSQDRFASEAYDYTGEATTWQALQRKVRTDHQYARNMINNMARDPQLNFLPHVIASVRKQYTYLDLIKTRFNQMQGRASRAKKSGQYLEQQVETMLDALGYVKNRTYFHDRKAIFDVNGQKTETHKDVDYLLPSIKNPQILIEVKAYTSTGSKQTDFAGDIIEKVVRDIPETIRDHVKVYIVTDGASWRLRQSDLKNMFAYRSNGSIDGIFQLKTLSLLADRIQRVLGHVSSKTLLDWTP